MLDQKAFDLIVEKTGASLAPQGFQRDKNGENETTALFVGESVAYSVFFDEQKKQFELRACAMTEDGPDEKWKVLSRWLFEPEERPLAEAESIANDFVETIEGPRRVAAVQTAKRKSKGGENNADPLFFFNRLVGIFPELREEITEERSWYGMVRGVTFAREHVLPKIETFLNSARPEQMKRLCDVLGDMYVAGDMDVRSIITIVLLNGIHDPEIVEQKMVPQFRKELQEAYRAGKKYRGKTVKPEKKKKEKKYSAETLNDLR
ncbi:DUF7674 family protein [Anaeromassilibacillus sp. Marseille-P3371]|uniref:DUF7674 family protein n=1 Tax=Anaeromassilibacillus sp. Marseille-P3371 TaxID=1944639 RepID=UPI001FA84232|nr:hypothetical protein [Anaeromassilibacillus sp. Marseille-P3371]